MRKSLPKVVLALIVLLMSSPNFYSNDSNQNFCFDADVPEAQAYYLQMCVTSPIIICPSAYFGCPDDSTDPSVTGSATAMPGDANCPDPIVTYSDEVVMNTTCMLKIHRKWRAEYPAGTGNPWLYAECIQIIENTDDVVPSFNQMPSDVTVSGNGLNCSVPVAWSEPVPVDNCSIDSITTSHVNGSIFDEGLTTVYYTVNDSCGNVGIDSFNITVQCIVCDTPPVITCPPDQVRCPITGDTSPASTGFATAVPGSNICGSPIITYSDSIVSSGPCNGQMVIERTWTATDPEISAMSSSCVQIIHVNDDIAPSIHNIPIDVTIEGEGLNCTVEVWWNEPLASDNCGVQSFTSTYPAGFAFPEGTTLVVYTAVDNCGNTSIESFNVTIECQVGCPSPPIIHCPYTFIGCPGSAPHPDVSGWPSVYPGQTDCAQPLVTYTDHIVSSGPCNGAQIIDRIWTATDPENPTNTTSCTQTIKLQDHAPPTFGSCPSDIVLAGTGSNCSMVATWTIPQVWDNCGVQSLTAVDQYGHVVHSGDYFNEGVTYVTYYATDYCGNVSQCSFKITVSCTSCVTAPSIYCPSDVWVCIGSNTSPQYLGYATATGGQHCPTPIITHQDWIMSTGPCPGQKVIKRIWTASYPGVANLISSCEQFIYMEDNNGPMIYNCPNNIYVNASQNPVYWTPPTAVDMCGSVSLTSNYYPGTNFPYGTTTVTYTATDGCGNVSYCHFNVTVHHDVDPLECPDDIYVSCSGSGGAYVNWDPPVYNGSCGNCDNGHYIPGFIFMGEYDGHQYYCSTSPKTWPEAKAICESKGGYLTSINSAGENNFLANILTLQSAWIGLSDHQYEGNFKWSNGDPVGYTNWYPGQPNNYGYGQDYVEMLNSGLWNDQYNNYSLEFIMELPCSSVEQVSGPAPGSYLQGGTYTVVYSLSDACGASSTCSFDIHVSGGLNLDCPDDIVMTAPYTSSGVTLTWNEPQATTCCNNCNGNGNYIPGFVYMGSLHGHHYYCSTSPATWQNAQANCVANGGNLAVVTSAAENNFIASKLTTQSAYIGLSDHLQEGTFKWVDGSPLSYTNWYPGQPNNYGVGQDYVEMLSSGLWNDQYANSSLEYVMEISDCLTVTQIGGPPQGTVVPPGSSHTITYKAEDGCGNVETCSFDITVQSPTNPNPCTSGGQYSYEYHVDNVEMGDINNTSGDNNGYGDFTNLCTSIEGGQNYDISLTPGFGPGVVQKVYWKVWIDYNQDGDFLDPLEFVAYGSGTGTLSGVITTPPHLYTGKTIMRVAMSLGRYPANPCEIVTYGETEDYCIYIKSTLKPQTFAVNKNNSESAAAELTAEISELNIYPNPGDDILNLEFESLIDINEIQISDMNGKLVKSINTNGQLDAMKIETSELVTGMYILTIDVKQGMPIVKRFLIQH